MVGFLEAYPKSNRTGSKEKDIVASISRCLFFFFSSSSGLPGRNVELLFFGFFTEN